MATTNCLLVVSDVESDILEFRSKLVLLRNIDSIVNTTTNNAVEFCRKYYPDTVIAFAHTKNQRLFEMCKALRHDPVLKNTPIIFIFDKFEEELLLPSLDAGISDYIILPATNLEILTRVIICLQKNETTRELEKKETLLRDLGVIDDKLGMYSPQFISKAFSNEIIMAEKYKKSLVLMAVSLDAGHRNSINENYLASVIKKSIRGSDVVGLPEEGRLYVLLHKTNINGAHIVYEKIKKNLGNNISISAGICESFEGMTYVALSKSASHALNEALSRGGSRILTFDQFEKKEEQILTQHQTDESKSWLNKMKTTKKSYDSFKQEFIQKVDCIIGPIFRQKKADIVSKYSTSIVVEQVATESSCFFCIRDIFRGSEATIKIIDPGFPKLIFDSTKFKDGKPETKRLNLEISELTQEFLIKNIDDLLVAFGELITKDNA